MKAVAPYVPTPEEIVAEMQAIQADWPEGEYQRRREMMPGKGEWPTCQTSRARPDRVKRNRMRRAEERAHLAALAMEGGAR